jgi:DNA-binding transcriptional MerR regulator
VTLAPIAPSNADRLLRIQEVAEEVGLTARSIRYYEEKGLLKPAARSEGDYRLYDADDIERLRYIKAMRDDAGFSLADIGQLLEDETARARTRERFRATTDAAERRALLHEGIARIDRQVETLRTKIARLEAMIGNATDRRAHLEGHVAELDATGEIAPHPAGPHATRSQPKSRRPTRPEAGADPA